MKKFEREIVGGEWEMQLERNKKKECKFFFMKIWTRRKGKKWMVKTQTKKEKKLKEEGNKRKKARFFE